MTSKQTPKPANWDEIHSNTGKLKKSKKPNSWYKNKTTPGNSKEFIGSTIGGPMKGKVITRANNLTV